jgi:hypothetical protein
MKQTKEQEAYWQRRFTDPVIRWQWNNAIKVNPIKEGGIGSRVYPNGVVEYFGKSILHI